MADKRRAVAAGSFYPENTTVLKAAVESYFSQAGKRPIAGEIVALMAPHAGYVFSGLTAAYAYSAVKGTKFDTVVIVGNSHNFRMQKGAVYPDGSFVTPAGEVAIDEKLADALVKNGDIFEANMRAHEPEHSIEVQIPFLLSAVGNFKIVPVLLGAGWDDEKISRAAGLIAAAVKKHPGKTLIVASSDMSHFPSNRDARRIDAATLAAIGKFDTAALAKTTAKIMAEGVPELGCALCGDEAVRAVMTAAKLLGADKAEVIHYSNSSDTSRDSSRVVGYGAVNFIKSFSEKSGGQKTSGGAETESNDTKTADFGFTEEQRRYLLGVARKAIENHFARKRPDKKHDDEALKFPAAVFVTLTQDGKLRGCIGTTVEMSPLIYAVREMAVAAAVDDPRFSPLSEHELACTRIEISVLSPLKRAASADEIIAGTHGVVVKSGGRGGLFLPQVWEHFARKEDFLSELCSQKAGLNPDAWKDPSTELYIFTVVKFEE